MKDATKRGTPEAIIHMLVVMAMLVIASVLFYWRNDRPVAVADDDNPSATLSKASFSK